MPEPVHFEDFERAVSVFKAAWEEANARGQAGHRVEWGIHALINIGWTPRTRPSEPDPNS